MNELPITKFHGYSLMIGMWCLVILFVACHERPIAWNPEGILLQEHAVEVGVAATIGGMVYCSTCQAGSTMIVTVSEVVDQGARAIAQQPFDHVGAYELVVTVSPRATLKIHAQIFTAGGIITVDRQITVPDDQDTVALTVDMQVL